MRVGMLLLLALVPAHLSAQLCPADSGARRSQESAVPESAFTAEAAQAALLYFKTSLPQLIAQHPNLADLQSVDMYYLGYGGNLQILEGWVLKQAALEARLKMELAATRLAQGRGTPADVAAARVEYQAKRERFCAFLANARYSD